MKKFGNIASISAFALAAMIPQVALSQTTYDTDTQDPLIAAAQSDATQALSDAAAAQAAAGVADGKAVAAQTDATQALSDAAAAQAAASVADGKAVAAQTDATQALSDAAAAQSTADQAAADIGVLRTDVDTLRTDTNTLRTDVNNLAANDLVQDAAIGVLQGDVGVLRTDVNTLRTDTNVLRTDVDVLRTDVNTAQATADQAIDMNIALGNSAANALGGGATYNVADGSISAPTYNIQGSAYNSVGTALDAINTTLNQHGTRLDNLDTKVVNLQQQQDLQNRQANGGIAAAMALGGAMIVPDSTVSVNFNIATYRGEQGFAGNLTFRASERVYFNGGVVGSTVRGSTGGRVGVAFGF